MFSNQFSNFHFTLYIVSLVCMVLIFMKVILFSIDIFCKQFVFFFSFELFAFTILCVIILFLYVFFSFFLLSHKNMGCFCNFRLRTIEITIYTYVLHKCTIIVIITFSHLCYRCMYSFTNGIFYIEAFQFVYFSLVLFSVYFHLSDFYSGIAVYAFILDLLATPVHIFTFTYRHLTCFLFFWRKNIWTTDHFLCSLLVFSIVQYVPILHNECKTIGNMCFGFRDFFNIYSMKQTRLPISLFFLKNRLRQITRMYQGQATNNQDILTSSLPFFQSATDMHLH